MAVGQELKVCPVCGEMPKWRGSAREYRIGLFRLQCLGETHLVQSYGATEQIAIAAWNTRASAPSGEGEGRAALLEAVSRFARLEKSIMADVQTAHNRGPGASSAMREDDRDMRADLREAFAFVAVALSIRGPAQ